METTYKDPKELRYIPLERLKFEGNKLALQFNEWNAIFDIQSAIRVNNKKATDGRDSITEVQMWSILSNRYLLLEREHMTDYKLFTKDEVLRMITAAYNQGWQDGRYSEEEKKKQHEGYLDYLETVKNI
jgi:hypothetical protein